MYVETFIELAEAYGNLGWAVQEQLRDIADETAAFRDGELNANAVREVQTFAERMTREVGSGWDLVAQNAAEYLEREGSVA